ncbi:MAG: hypothetical protein NC248_05135 [Bacteroides sp.]|nr:hypothetical protein [Bacteroides sp.]MCM1389418.1 hypothetical protein [Bacteroides sp.]
MKAYSITSIAIAAAALCAAACSSTKNSTETQSPIAAPQIVTKSPTGGNPSSAVPKAVVYRTNGDFIHNVPITLSVDRKNIVSYPAPTDLSENSLPVELADGYLLDRRGINANTAFTIYTYKEYSEMENAPSLKELKDAIIGGAEVVEIIVLPMTLSQALDNIPECNTLVKDGFPGCDIKLQRRAIQINQQEE